MRVLVTGAGGFIGRHVVAALAQRDDVELVLTGRTVDALAGLPGEHVRWDIADTPVEDLYVRFGRPERLIHLAWGALGDFRSTAHVREVLPQQLHFIEALLAQGLPDVTVTGTCLEYGLQGGCLVESLPTKPVVAYGIAKDALCKMLVAMQDRQVFSLRWLRLFYMYGEGQSSKSVVPLLQAAMARGDAEFPMSPGDQLRDYLPVAAVAEAIVLAALQNRVTGVVNVGSGQPLAVKSLIDAQIALAGGGIEVKTGVYPYADYEPRNFWADVTRLQSLHNNENRFEHEKDPKQ